MPRIRDQVVTNRIGIPTLDLKWTKEAFSCSLCKGRRIKLWATDIQDFGPGKISFRAAKLNTHLPGRTSLYHITQSKTQLFDIKNKSGVVLLLGRRRGAFPYPRAPFRAGKRERPSEAGADLPLPRELPWGSSVVRSGCTQLAVASVMLFTPFSAASQTDLMQGWLSLVEA